MSASSRSSSRLIAVLSRRTLLKWAALTGGSALLGSCAALERTPPSSSTPTLNLFTVSDRFGTALQQIVPQFEAASGIRIVITINGYPELYQRAISDFIGGTAQADLYAVDIVWTGEWAENNYLVDLTDRLEENRAALALDDILPVMWKLGEWQGRQHAFPLAGYAGMLNYNRSALAGVGYPEGPKTLTELREAAEALTAGDVYGIAINGARGAAVAQDWMYYMLAHGGSLLDENGQPSVDSATNIAALEYFRDLFSFTPPGAISYAWPEREQAFNEGRAMMQMAWSTGLRDKLNPETSRIAGELGITGLPLADGVTPKYPFGGWGLGINCNSPNIEPAWEFIRWLAQPEMQKEFVRLGSEPIRRSTLTDPDLLAEFPYFAEVLPSLEQGDGDFRPRVPQYARLQDALGLVVNQVITDQLDPDVALQQVQAEMQPFFQS
ncbi:substrate-binding domain-containing protein [Synechococcus sp. Nb3U1]|uniref:substrate-binding domain-containing protein n=1 Tax=Synechococcus sp. Nb3U1 TaxID=1914529 RepID=UPI001F1B3E6C|nr:substrate-binding domain-containing protein [Synechococcus sp. Nb3U1]MCF2971805.1 substrate-binding domain-containing protein [Synechococcus sp. Nb3U1]